MLESHPLPAPSPWMRLRVEKGTWPGGSSPGEEDSKLEKPLEGLGEGPGWGKKINGKEGGKRLKAKAADKWRDLI